jgi:hypothetical protein
MTSINNNPMTTAVGAGALINAALHYFNINIPGLDPTTIDGALLFLLGLVAKDFNVTGGTKPQ